MISFEDKGDKVKSDTPYDYDIYKEIKMIKDAFFDVYGETWTLDKSYLNELVKNLREMNKEIGSTTGLIDSTIKQKKYERNDKINPIKTVKIKVKSNKKSLTIGFDFDNKVLEKIKMLENRSFNKSNKTWRVGKGEVDWLYEQLIDLEYVDVSELKPFTIYNSDNQISLKKSDFPYMKKTPRDYQVRVAESMVNRKRTINALEAGLGKTLTAIMATEKINQKTLIVVTASIKYNWKNEILDVNPNADIQVLDSKSKWRDSQYTIINYDILGTFIDDIMQSDINVLILDESHKIRGIDNRGRPSSQRARHALDIADKVEYAFLLTATPIINSTKDIYNQLKAIQHPSTDNWYAFANTYCSPNRTNFGVDYRGSSNQDLLNKRLAGYMVRLRTEEYVELPERTREFIPVKINLNKYNKKVEEYMSNSNADINSGGHLVYLTAMRQELAIAKAKHTEKIAKDVIEQNKSVVIFTNHTDVVDYLYSKFDAVKVVGGMSAKERQASIEMFQNGEKKVFIGNMDAAGEGITLTKAHHMIINDFHWSPITMINQVEKRIHRLTQTQPCIIQYIYSDEAKMDRMQLDMLNEKLNSASQVVDGTSEDFFIKELIKLL